MGAKHKPRIVLLPKLPNKLTPFSTSVGYEDRLRLWMAYSAPISPAK
jgi:hypothetical protein